jgi:histidinol-phosphatase (PHP family)
MLVNYHFHDHYSMDGQGTLEENVKLAIKNGVKHLGITNHAEIWPYGPTELFIEEAVERFLKSKNEFLLVQKKYPELSMRFGYELDIAKKFWEQHEIIQEKVAFDFRVGSVHQLDSHVIANEWVHDLCKKHNQKDLMRIYFEEMLKCLAWGHFDHVGHFDIIKRRSTEFYNKVYDIEDHLPVLNKIADLILENDFVVEVNTSGFFTQAKEAFPDKKIIELFLKKGIKKWTLGSDSHSPEDFTKGLKEGAELLAQFGVEPFYYS